MIASTTLSSGHHLRRRRFERSKSGWPRGQRFFPGAYWVCGFFNGDMDTVDQLKSEVVSACKILSKQKLVEGFGHVSARIPDSDRFLLTPRISLAMVKEEEDLLTLNLAGEIVAGNYPAPFESWLHAAIMKSQP